jgi:hypothetical protein
MHPRPIVERSVRHSPHFPPISEPCEALELPHRPSPQHLIDETKDLLEETPFKRITGINCVAGQKQITRLDLLHQLEAAE